MKSQHALSQLELEKKHKNWILNIEKEKKNSLLQEKTHLNFELRLDLLLRVIGDFFFSVLFDIVLNFLSF